jgi:FkbM family methyltransferase
MIDKVELLRKLDLIATEDVTLSTIIETLKEGQSRTLRFEQDNLPILTLQDGIEFYWDRHDPRTAVSCLVVQGFYEKIETVVLKHFAKLGGSVIDIGANVGYYALVLGSLISGKDKLIAIEANPRVYSNLQKNISLNSMDDKVVLENLLLSDKEELVKFYEPISSGSSAASLRNLHPEEDSVIQNIASARLDDLKSLNNLDCINLIKIDVEGAELEVIKGALEIIKLHTPVIFVELLRKWSKAFGYHPNDVLNLLKDLGYQAYEVNIDLTPIEQIDELTISTNFLLLQDNEKNRNSIKHLRNELIKIS